MNEPIDMFVEDVNKGKIYRLGRKDLYKEFNRILEYKDIINLGESFYSSLLGKNKKLDFLKGVKRKDIVEYIFDILSLEEFSYKFDLEKSKIENLEEIFLYKKDLNTEISRQEGISIFSKAYELYKYEKNLDSKGIFYRLEKDGKELYILGTIHVGNKSIYPFSRKINEIVARADRLSVEANIIEDTLGANYLISKGTIDEGELKDYLSGDLYKKLEDKLEEYGDSIDNYSYSKPWFIAMMLENININLFDIDLEAGIDYNLMDKFIRDKKEIVELEGVRYQVDLLDSLNKDLEEKFLSQTLESLDKEDNKIEGYFEAWRRGDGEQFDSLIYQAETDMEDGIQNILLKKRNKNILEKIDEYFEDDKLYLVLVGTGHLFGRDGLIDSLKESYRVESIK